MKKILVVSQKELVEKPIFKQDKNLSYVFNMLSEENKIDLLYLHKNMNVDDEEKGNNEDKDKKYMNVRQICIRDLMSNNMLQKNLKELINKNGYEEIIFMSYSLAQFVMPYIEEDLEKMVVVVDYRLSNISYLLQQYKEEKQKQYHDFQGIYKQFRLNFLQSIAIFQKGDYFIFDRDEIDTSLLEKENIENIVSIEDIKNLSVKKENVEPEQKVIEIEINSDNFFAKMPFNVNEIDKNKFVVLESKHFSLIDTINDIIFKSKAEYFFIHKTKLSILSNTEKLLAQYLSFNKNLAVISPLSIFSRDNTKIQQQYTFDIQRKGNFSNWEKTAPLKLSDCFIIKKSFLNKYGYFDNKYKTMDYALFDFLMRIYQKRGYYCTARDIVVFKLSNVTKRLEIFKEDKQYLCYKWGENNFLF